MTVLFKMAWRNIQQHKTKTWIVGTLMTIGIAVIVIGHSLMDGAAMGIRQSYTHNYTGDVVVSGLHRSPLTLFGATHDLDGFDAVLPVIPHFDQVYDFVMAHPDVVTATPQTSHGALVSWDDAQMMTFLFGIDPERYTEVFPDSMEMLWGRFWQASEEGIVINEAVADVLEKRRERPLEPGDHVLLTGMNQIAGIKVREVPVTGVFRFKQGDPQVDLVSYIDVDNTRALAGMRLTAISEAELSPMESYIFGTFDEDALFGGDDLFGDLFGELIVEEDVAPVPADVVVETTDGVADSVVEPEDDSGAWHFLLIRLRDGASPLRLNADLNTFFAENDIAATTVDWMMAAGPLAGLASGVKTVFNIVIFVVAVVAVIIIMNTLVISVTERTVEIGTMRALGAQRRFVRRLVMVETITLTFVFGALGVAVGSAILGVVRMLRLEAPNPLFEIVYGGPVLQPVPSVSSMMTSVILVIVIGLLASWYPVSIAMKTKPVRAMQR